MSKTRSNAIYYYDTGRPKRKAPSDERLMAIYMLIKTRPSISQGAGNFRGPEKVGLNQD